MEVFSTMSRHSNATNQYLIDLIQNLKKTAIEQKVNIWKAVATELEKPARIRRIINVDRINRVCNDKEVIVVPGKVLGTGDLNKSLTIAAFSFSESASQKINQKGKTLTIEELIKTNPKGSRVRIIG